MTRPCRCFNYNCGRCLPAPTCAVCANEITGPVHREPIGRNDALVPVCSRCATERPISEFGPEMAYEPDDRMPTNADSRLAKAPAAIWSGGFGLEHEPGRGWIGGNDRRPATSAERTAKRKERRVKAAGGGNA